LYALVFLAAALFAVSCGAPRSYGETAETNHSALEAFNLRMSGKLEEAGRVLNKALKADRENSRALFESARLSFAMKDIDSAQKSIRKAIKQDPDNARYHYWSGIFAVYGGVKKHHKLLTVLGMPGQFSRARKSFGKTIKLKPDHYEARLRLIELYQRLPWMLGGRTSKAREHVQELEQLDPIYGAKGRCTILATTDEREALWGNVVAEHEDDAVAHRELGRILRLAGKKQEAIVHFSKALELAPDWKDVLLDLARCHQTAQYYQQYLDSVPALPLPKRVRIMRWLGNLEKERGNTKKAEHLLEQVEILAPQAGFCPRGIGDIFVAP